MARGEEGRWPYRLFFQATPLPFGSVTRSVRFRRTRALIGKGGPRALTGELKLSRTERAMKQCFVHAYGGGAQTFQHEAVSVPPPSSVAGCPPFLRSMAHGSAPASTSTTDGGGTREPRAARCYRVGDSSRAGVGDASLLFVAFALSAGIACDRTQTLTRELHTQAAQPFAPETHSARRRFLPKKYDLPATGRSRKTRGTPHTCRSPRLRDVNGHLLKQRRRVRSREDQTTAPRAGVAVG